METLFIIYRLSRTAIDYVTTLQLRNKKEMCIRHSLCAYSRTMYLELFLKVILDLWYNHTLTGWFRHKHHLW